MTPDTSAEAVERIASAYDCGTGNFIRALAAERDAAKICADETLQIMQRLKAALMQRLKATLLAERNAARLEGWRAGLEAAARDVDCGCDDRPRVVILLSQHERRAAKAQCARGFQCRALLAWDIRALTPPAEWEAGNASR